MNGPSDKQLDVVSIFNSAPDNYLILSPDAPCFTILGATDAYLQFTYTKRENIIGRGLFEVFPDNPQLLNATGVKNLSGSLNYVLKHKKEHRMNDQRYDVVNPASGDFEYKVWSALNKPVLNKNGEVQYIMHTVEDITSRAQLNQSLADLDTAKKVQESEARFRSLLKAAPIGIALFKGRELVIEMINETMISLWGKEDAVIGMRFADVMPELENQAMFNILDEVYSSGKVFQTTEKSADIVHNSKLKRGYYDFSFTPLFDEQGKVYAVLNLATEVTERVLTRQALEESENNLRNMILQAPVAMLILRGRDMIVETINERMLEMIGKTASITNRPLLEVLPELEGQQGYESFLRVYKEGKPVYGNEILVPLMRDGMLEERHFNFAYTPIIENGKVVGVMDVAMEVTEQVQARKKIEESEAELQKRVAERTTDLNQQKAFIGSILDASLAGIYALKAVRMADGGIADFQYLFANNQIAKLLHLDVDKIIGSSMLELLPENKSNGFFDLFCRLLETGKMHRDETHFVAQDMDHWFDFAIVSLDKDTLVVSIEDITEKKRSGVQMEEQRNLLDNILRNSSNGISVSKVFRDESGAVVDALTILANDAAVKYIGLPKDIYLSKKATEIEPTIMGSPYYQACVRTLETGEPFVMQYEMQATNRWLELTVSKLDNEHLIQIFTDVTPIKEAQLQLERSVDELKNSNQNLEQFAYAASHDLKEPMRKIQLFSDRLKDRLQDQLSSEDKKIFDRILHAAHRMSTLIDDLLMYSHISTGAVIDEKVDLNEKIQLVLEDLEVEIEENNASVLVEKLPTIKGHRRQLQQLFQNLIGNAIKYHKKGVPPQVNITSRIVSGNSQSLPAAVEKRNQQYCLLEVSDNGIGFDPKDAERIFHVFTRLHGNAEYKGTGLGLSIVRKVVENHHGYIWAESTPGQGTSFKVLLPIE